MSALKPAFAWNSIGKLLPFRPDINHMDAHDLRVRVRDLELEMKEEKACAGELYAENMNHEDMISSLEDDKYDLEEAVCRLEGVIEAMKAKIEDLGGDPNEDFSGG